MTATPIFEDDYSRVKISGVEYRIYQEYSKKEIKKFADLVGRSKRMLLIEKAKPFPIIAPSNRYLFYMSHGGDWSMRAVDHSGRPRDYIRDVVFSI